jgi:uncharacterized membrane protein
LIVLALVTAFLSLMHVECVAEMVHTIVQETVVALLLKTFAVFAMETAVHALGVWIHQHVTICHMQSLMMTMLASTELYFHLVNLNVATQIIHTTVSEHAC